MEKSQLPPSTDASYHSAPPEGTSTADNAASHTTDNADLDAILGITPDPLPATSTTDEEIKRVQTNQRRRSRQAEWANDKKKFERIQAEGIERDPPCIRCQSKVAKNRIAAGHKCKILLEVCSKCDYYLENRMQCTQSGWKPEFKEEQREKHKPRPGQGRGGKQVQVRTSKVTNKNNPARNQGTKSMEYLDEEDDQEEQENIAVAPSPSMNFIRPLNNVTKSATPQRPNQETYDNSSRRPVTNQEPTSSTVAVQHGRSENSSELLCQRYTSRSLCLCCRCGERRFRRCARRVLLMGRVLQGTARKQGQGSRNDEGDELDEDQEYEHPDLP